MRRPHGLRQDDDPPCSDPPHQHTGQEDLDSEDPIEITQYGIRQVQVHPKIGLDFAARYRAFLRADPDVIMVGEMSDFETAKNRRRGVTHGAPGVQDTSHQQRPGDHRRLLDMGIDPLNFADSLLGILAQRLVRTLCRHCKRPTIRPRTNTTNWFRLRGGGV